MAAIRPDLSLHRTLSLMPSHVLVSPYVSGIAIEQRIVCEATSSLGRSYPRLKIVSDRSRISLLSPGPHGFSVSRPVLGGTFSTFLCPSTTFLGLLFRMGDK